jgi:hypothetical protein
MFLLKGILGLTLAQSAEVRELEDTTPQHLPIRFKIKKEKEKNFKDLENKQWLRDMVIEVRNTGDKPIYLLHLIVDLPDIITGGNMYGFSLHYGRNDLVLFSAPLRPDDVPIKPGETYTFTIPERISRGWERYSRENNTGEPRKVRLIFQRLNFDDGTGFGDSSGTPRPQPRRKTNHFKLR